MSSKLIESLRGDLAALDNAGAIGKVTMRQFVFAHLLHTSASTVRKWEQGDTRPAGPALKLLSVIADNGPEAVL